jgi:hypothetical protein
VQSPGQAMPPAELVTVPPPVPATAIVNVRVGCACAAPMAHASAATKQNAPSSLFHEASGFRRPEYTPEDPRRIADFLLGVLKTKTS